MITRLLKATRRLADDIDSLTFAEPVTHTYNPLCYAWEPHQVYLERYAASPKRVVFLGMNPGPFGMVQTGIPFGEIAAVRDWLGIEAPIAKPRHENAHRPIEGFACTRSEVSGRRLWGLFAERFGRAEAFFADHFVANYCPLAFFVKGRNLTPDKLPQQESAPLYRLCDHYLRELAALLQPQWVVGVGAFAEARALQALADMPVRIGRILHPSPASPAANRGFAEAAQKQMFAQGIWAVDTTGQTTLLDKNEKDTDGTLT